MNVLNIINIPQKYTLLILLLSKSHWVSKNIDKQMASMKLYFRYITYILRYE